MNVMSDLILSLTMCSLILIPFTPSLSLLGTLPYRLQFSSLNMFHLSFLTLILNPLSFVHFLTDVKHMGNFEFFFNRGVGFILCFESQDIASVRVLCLEPAVAESARVPSPSCSIVIELVGSTTHESFDDLPMLPLLNGNGC